MLTIAWDVDDVLNGLMREWFEQWRSRIGCSIDYAQISSNPPHEVLGIPLKEYLDSLDEFRLSAKAREMKPNPAVLAWFQGHGTKFRHIALTARPLDTAPAAAEWVLRHFGTYIRTFSVVPCRSTGEVPAYDLTKSEYLTWWGKADVLIDDSPANIEAAENAGVRGVLFPQPWNTSKLDVSKTLQLLTQLA